MFAILDYRNKSDYKKIPNIQEVSEIDFDLDYKYHEYLRHDTIVKPYYDIDKGFDNEKDYKINIRKLKLKWSKILNEKFPNCNLAVSCSSRYKENVALKNEGLNWFVSLHFVVNNYKIRMGDLKSYNIKLGLDKIDGYDNSVYKNGQNFRMINQSKCGSNIKLKPLNNKDDLYKFVIQDVKDDDETIIYSPPVSPVSSDEENIIEKKEKKIIEKCPKDKFLKLINGIKPRYSYNDWLNIGYICFNNFEGSEEGLNIWNDYSKKDKNEDKYEGKAPLKKQYEFFKKQNTNNKLSFLTLQKWYNEDNPIKNIYEYWYNNNILGEKMSETTMYFTPDGTILYSNNGKCLRTKSNIAKGYFSKFSFWTMIEDKKVKINPFDIWFNDFYRRDVNEFEFNPFTLESSKDCFNTWKGYKIKNTDDYDEKNIEPFLFHIKDVLANNDIEVYEYILNYFAHIIQKPYQRTNVCLCFKSIEGTGKTLFLDIIRKIMGDDTFINVNDMDKVLGRFNKQAESKILINFNETNWGGDVKSKGKFKALITDDKITIEEKGKEAYTTNNYSNCVISSNNEWLVSIGKDDRRFCLLECKNQKLPIEKAKIIVNINIEEIANFFYNRDISNFDATKFKKTEFHQDQVQLNWDSVQNFVYQLLNEEINDFEIGINKRIEKVIIYDYYISSCQATHSNKLNNVWFWKKLKKLIPTLKFIKATAKTAPAIEYTKSISQMKEDFENAIY
jgi:hypothetical protein